MEPLEAPDAPRASRPPICSFCSSPRHFQRLCLRCHLFQLYFVCSVCVEWVHWFSGRTRRLVFLVRFHFCFCCFGAVWPPRTRTEAEAVLAVRSDRTRQRQRSCRLRRRAHADRSTSRSRSLCSSAVRVTRVAARRVELVRHGARARARAARRRRDAHTFRSAENPERGCDGGHFRRCPGLRVERLNG